MGYIIIIITMTFLYMTKLHSCSQHGVNFFEVYQNIYAQEKSRTLRMAWIEDGADQLDHSLHGNLAGASQDGFNQGDSISEPSLTIPKHVEEFPHQSRYSMNHAIVASANGLDLWEGLHTHRTTPPQV